jgi:hypothetical protein
LFAFSLLFFSIFFISFFSFLISFGLNWLTPLTPSTLQVAINSDTNDTDAKLVPQAFKSVHLICNDYLRTLPLQCTSLCVQTLGSYGAQHTDLNIALETVGLLWGVADNIQRALVRSVKMRGNKGGEGGSPSSPSFDRFARPEGVVLPPLGTDMLPPSPNKATETSASLSVPSFGNSSFGSSSDLIAMSLQASVPPTEDVTTTLATLWLSIFVEVRRLCIDDRPELRSCSLHTLTSTLIIHGHALPPESWNYCITQILFPLLQDVEQRGITATSTEAIGKQLGKDRGKTVMMLMHHSRNTEQKQWDESRVVVLNGVAKIFSTYLQLLSSR